jgi:predicted methyltransferase
LYKWYIEGIEEGRIPVFNIKGKINEWKEPSKLMNILIDEAIDDGYLEWSSYGHVKLTKEGRLFARKEKIDKKYNCKECGKGD